MRADASDGSFLSNLTGTDSNLMCRCLVGSEDAALVKICRIWINRKMYSNHKHKKKTQNILMFIFYFGSQMAAKQPLVSTKGTNCPYVTYLWFLSDLFTITHCASLIDLHFRDTGPPWAQSKHTLPRPLLQTCFI